MKERSILFVCHGNICRSVMAEYILKSMAPGIRCESRAVSHEDEGRDIYYSAKQCLDRHGIAYDRHRARVISQKDYDSFDEIYVMDHENLNMIRRIINDYDQKVRMLTKQEIEDPWYTDRFDEVYEQIKDGIENIL
ncbi:MAG: low molecular weight phosphotyrosine protein phosphatase [Erysipelotrichaceae bacterium]|nr:low molecular weight phosphotyrosine protein phosphatase [Erysipelotrichaceae bacterium]